jgi:hypothetical protein
LLKDNQTTIAAILSNLSSIIESLQGDLTRLTVIVASQNQTIQRLEQECVIPYADFVRWGNGTCPPGSQRLVENGTVFVGSAGDTETGSFCAPWNTSLRITQSNQEFADYVVPEIDNRSPGCVVRLLKKNSFSAEPLLIESLPA